MLGAGQTNPVVQCRQQLAEWRDCNSNAGGGSGGAKIDQFPLLATTIAGAAADGIQTDWISGRSG